MLLRKLTRAIQYMRGTLETRFDDFDIDEEADTDVMCRPSEPEPTNPRFTYLTYDDMSSGAKYEWKDFRELMDDERLERGRSKGVRTWQDIRGITLHQTAVPIRSTHKRLTGIPAHAIVCTDGIVLLQHPEQYMWHGHALNEFTIGIEIACRAAGVEGNDRTVWLSRREKAAGKVAQDVIAEASEQQLEWARQLVDYYLALCVMNGHDHKSLGIYAHRQGHKSRTSDPGSRIWQNVAIPLRDGYGLRDTTLEYYGSGSAIPDKWSRKSNGIKY